jgi:hypothetical protein
VHDGADVSLVDAHAKGDRGDDDLEAALQKRMLHALALLRRQAGVIGGAGEAFVGEFLGDFFGLLARRRIEDGRPVRGVGDGFGRQGPTLGGRAVDDLEGEVFATKAVDETLRLLGAGAQSQQFDDVVLHRRRRRRRERHDGGGAQKRQALAEHAVFGAEIVAPMRDAVGLVDGDEGRGLLAEHLGEAGHGEALGGEEQEIELAAQVVPAGLARGLAVDARVDARGAEALGEELVGLVIHQGNQWTDDDDAAADALAPGEAGQLVAEALAGAGGHDDEGVVAVGDALADGLLVGAKGVEAEAPLQERQQRHRRRWGRGRAGARGDVGLHTGSAVSTRAVVQGRCPERMCRCCEGARIHPEDQGILSASAVAGPVGRAGVGHRIWPQ